MTTKEVIDTVEDTLDTIEEQLDILEDGMAVVKSTKLVVGIIVGASLVGSAALTYFIMKKKLEAKYEAVSKAEIAEAREYFQRNTKPDSPTKLAAQYVKEIRATQDAIRRELAVEGEDPDMEKLREITSSYQSEDLEKAREALAESRSEVVETNVFATSVPDDDFDVDEEERHRSEDRPYILGHDEFMASEKDYNQATLTYYEGDDVLTDDKDQPIEDTNNTVGDDNLLKFGHGSRDNNIIYIRNDRLSLEFEIVRSPGKYVEQVLGFIEHSARDRRPRKFRSDDD